MRFWPFGKSDREERLDFQSRVVSATAKDGKQLRGKLTVHFVEPELAEAADPMADEAARALRDLFESAPDAHEVVADEGELGRLCLGGLRSASKVRSIDVVAVHVIGEEPHAPATRRPVSSSAPPPHAPAPSRRSSSSQMLAVRDSRLIPEGASAEAAGFAIVPLLRDASTRVTVGMLRAYDLLFVRQVELGADDFSELVPVSTAAPGRFATERKDELERWDEKLGADKMSELSGEAAAIVCYFLHNSLEQTGIDSKIAIAVLESAAHSAFPDGHPLADLPRYLAVASNPTDALASRAIAALGVDNGQLNTFAVMLAPILASLQEDFGFTATQIQLSGVRSA